MEKFFDDHLGASEREGMDQENLPTNLVPLIMRRPNMIPGPERDTHYNAATSAANLVAETSNEPRSINNRQESIDKDPASPYTGLASNPTMS